tara:strand:- start:1650 stop:2945 length:1296 start_codon:yes stop_codon:yes gene_type:complete
MVGYQGSFTTNTAPYAVKTEPYTYSYVASIGDELNQLAVNYTADGWTFNGDLKPALTIIRGEKYRFALTSSGHPFYLQTTPGPYNAAQTYTTGVTSSGIQVGNVDWTVDASAPATLYYVDSADNTNFGTINVIAQPSPAIGTPIYSVVSGALPSGFSMSTAGVLSGTTTAFGAFAFTLRATFTGQSYVETEVAFTVYDIVIQTFTSSTTYTPSATVQATLYVVGGGGAGGHLGSQYSGQASGGNGGDVMVQSRQLVAGTTYTINIGAGGPSVSGAIQGGDGGNTTAFYSNIFNCNAGGGNGGGANNKNSGYVQYTNQITGESVQYNVGNIAGDMIRGGAGAGGLPFMTVGTNAGSSGQAGIGRTINGNMYGSGGGNNGGYNGGSWGAYSGGGSGQNDGVDPRGGGGGGKFGSGGSGRGGNGVAIMTYPVIT